MKRLIFILPLLASLNAIADCRVYLQIDSVLKESERALTMDLSLKHLKGLGYSVTPTLDNADAVLKITLKPLLVERKFLYQAVMELMQTSGEVNRTTSKDQVSATTLKKALESLPTCEL